MIKVPPRHKLRPLHYIFVKYLIFARMVIGVRFRLMAGNTRVRWDRSGGILIGNPMKIWRLVIFQYKKMPRPGKGKKFRL